MKRILLALAALLLGTAAHAQTQFPANTLWGNTATTSGLPTAVPVPSCATGALNYTPGTGFGCGTGGGGVTSVFSRTGAVAAQTGDYSFSQISGSLALTSIASIGVNTVLGNVGGAAAAPIALSATQLTTLCNAFSSTLSGCVLASGGGTANFLRADGQWVVPPGGTGAVTSVSANDTSMTIAPTTGAVKVALNVANANTWTTLQTFNAGTSDSALTLSGVHAPAGQFVCLHADQNGLVSGTGSECGSSTGGGVTSVTSPAGDSTLTFVNTSGAVTGKLNLANANTWTATQTLSGLTLSGVTGSGFQCLHASSAGVVSGTTGDCASGAITGITSTGSTLTITGSAPTLNLDIALNHANTWSAAQTFTGLVTASGNLLIPLTHTLSMQNAASTNFAVLSTGAGHDTILAVPDGTAFVQGHDSDTTGGNAKFGYLFNDTLNIVNRANTQLFAQFASTGLAVNTGSITLKPASGNSFVTIDTSAASLQAGFNLLDNGTAKWQFIRQASDDTFLIYDVTGGRSLFVAYPNGGVTFAQSGGLADPGVGGVAATKFISGLGVVTSTIGSGGGTLGAAAIASAACSAVTTVAAAGVLATDVVSVSFAADPTGQAGFIPSTNGMLAIFAWPTAGNVNFKVCNNTSASITPGSWSINWRVAR